MAKVTKYLTGSTLEQMKGASGEDVNVQNIKKFINIRCIDHDYENALYTYRKIQEFRRNHPHLKQKDAEAILGKGFSHGTISRYWKPENAPVPKKIFGLVPGDEGKSRIAMTSVANDDSTILRIILRLYAGVFNSENPRFECDLTFSKGDFYRKSAPYPEFCFDLFPNQPNDLIDAPHVYPLMSEDNSESAETLLKDGSVKSIVIDLPQSISNTGESGIEGFADVKDMAVSYYNMLSLAYRKLRPESESQSGGILVVKVGDINYKGRRIWMSKIVSELATGNLTRLSEPIIAELQSEAKKEGKSFEEKFPLFDLMLRDKIVHLYKEDEIKKYDDENPRSLKDHDFFLIFQKGKDKTELETFFIYSDNENKDSFLSNFLLEESNCLNIFSDLSKVKKPGSDKCKSYYYKVYLPKGTINDCVWSNQRVSNSIKNKLKSYRNIPEDKFETGDSLLKYLEGKKESVHEDNIENILKLNRSELDKINRKIKELEEDKNYYLSESKNKEIRKLEKEIKGKLKTKKQLEKTIKENESLKKSTKKARINSEKPLDIISEETAILLKNAGVKYIDIVCNGKKDYIKRLVLDKQDMKIEPLNPIADRQMEKRNKELFYHGSGVLFDSFDLEHALEGDGKVKFGYGIYVTSSYKSAAHYSGANEAWNSHYVYTLTVPVKKVDNFIAFRHPVNPEIIKRTEEKLRIKISDKVISDGKEFRKFLAKHFSDCITIDLMPGADYKKIKNLMGEKAASEFLSSIGVDFIEWPYNWNNPDLGTNRAYLDDKKIEIIKVDQIELDNKKNLIPNSKKQIR